MKKLLVTCVALILIFGAFMVSFLGIAGFFKTFNMSSELETINVVINDIQWWEGRNPSLSLMSDDNIYEVPNMWFDKLDSEKIKNTFNTKNVYDITVKTADIENNTNESVIYAYGIADEQGVYLLAEDAISGERSNSVFGLACGILILAAIIVLIILVINNRKSVVTFLKEFSGSPTT